MEKKCMDVKSTRCILFFGATGTIGEPILRILLENLVLFQRLAIFTSPGGSEKKQETLLDLKSKGVEVITGDIRNEQEIRNAYRGIDTVISALGRGAIASQTTLIRLADETSSVWRFIPSEFGTDIEHSSHSAHEKPHQDKIKIRKVLASTETLNYTCLVTGPYADAEPPAYLSALIENPELGSFNVKARTAVLLGDGRDRIALTTTSDVGKLLLLVLTHPAVTSRRALKLKSFVTTPLQILAEFQRQTASEWVVSYTSREKLRQLEKEAWDSKAPMAPIYTLRRIWTEGGTLYDEWDNKDIGGNDMDTLADAVSLAIEQQNSIDQTVDTNKQFS